MICILQKIYLIHHWFCTVKNIKLGNTFKHSPSTNATNDNFGSEFIIDLRHTFQDPKNDKLDDCHGEEDEGEGIPNGHQKDDVNTT